MLLVLQTGLIVGIAVPIVVVALILIFAIIYVKRRKEVDDEKGESINVSQNFYYMVIVVIVYQKKGASYYRTKNHLIQDFVRKFEKESLFTFQLGREVYETSCTINARQSDLHLDWPTRFNIYLSTARALTYLHEESRPRIVHRNVKASNILLDAKFCPKISDFGLVKLYDDKKMHISTQVARTM